MPKALVLAFIVYLIFIKPDGRWISMNIELMFIYLHISTCNYTMTMNG